MNPLFSFIMSKKFLPVLIALLISGLLITFGVKGNNDKNIDPKEKYQLILKNVGIVLEQGHYNPQKIDDQFSKKVFDNYLKILDNDKYIFLQKDIDGFKKYQTRIDDEIHGAPLESFYAISSKYLERIDEVSAIYKEILSKPFHFDTKETLQTEGDKRTYSKTEAERYEYCRKRLKYMVLGRVVDLQEERENSKDSVHKSDEELIKEAVDKVSKQMDRYFTTLKSHNTTDDMFSTFVNAITGVMDPHTTYMAPIDKRSFNEMLSGKFYGIGAQLQEKDGKITVVSLITGMPAWKSGEIHPEDELIKVGQGNAEPVDVTGYNLSDAVKLIRGERKGSEVRLTLRKPDGSLKVVSLLRDEISLEDTYAKSAIIQNGKERIGYIYLPEFYADFENMNARRAATDVAKEILKLKEEKVDGIIMDLRGNGGGSLTDVVEMVGLFIKNGPVVQVKGRNEKIQVLSDDDNNMIYSGPLTVMVDELSASASEIFAAAIQDYKRGIVIGSTSTYGKGTVQRPVPLDPQSRNTLFASEPQGLGDVKLTFRKFYRINGGTTQKIGVIPDIIIPDRLENAKFREKDNPNSLGWDTIAKADYRLWDVDYTNIIKNANQQINTDADFLGIRKITNEMEKYRYKEVSLNISDFKKEKAQIRALSKQLEKYSDLKDSLTVFSLRKDLAEIGSDSEKVKKQEQFIKTLKGDKYVDEVIKVMSKMIENENARYTHHPSAGVKKGEMIGVK